MRKLLIVFCLLSITLIAGEQVFVPNSMGLNDLEYAQWITHPEINGHEPGVYHFRKTFDVEEDVDSFIIHVSADNRYILFVNGEEICYGPARGDIQNWQFESVDVTSHIKQGKNVISAVVWNTGLAMKPWAQMIKQTAFYLQADLNNKPFIYSDDSWKVVQNKAYTFFKEDDNPRFPGGGGPGEFVNYSQYPFDWQQNDFEDSQWSGTKIIKEDDHLWHLVPRTIPFMEEHVERFQSIRRFLGVSIHDGFLKGEKDLFIPDNTESTLLLDQTYVLIAYPELLFSGGKGSQIKITYNEALFDKEGKKGHRNDLKDRELLGIYDVIRPNGKSNVTYRPLWYRSYRFVQIEVQTRDEPLIIHDFYSMKTGYPFELKASFKCDDPVIQKIWDVCWQTAITCAHESYVDCSYYEQLQYVGDTRLQGIVSHIVTGDARLIRQAIEHFDQSRFPDGLTACAYPSDEGKKIPPFSLFWVSMIYDYWWYTGDESIIEEYSEGIQGVLNWFEKYLQDGLITNLPDDSWDESKNWRFDYWNYVDDTPGWKIGVPNGVYHGGQPAAISVNFAYALQQAGQMFEVAGLKFKAEEYLQMAEIIKKAVYDSCWDPQKQMLADTPEKKYFSQHVNAMAILIDMFNHDVAEKLMTQLIEDPPPIKCSIYYRFYLHRALKKAGLGDRFVEMMDLWKEMLNMGFTTFPEHPRINTRSDCHGWGAHPMIDYVSTICGVEPGEPGFKSVRIEPKPGPLNHIQAAVPHSLGMIRVEYEKVDGKLKAEIKLPDGLEGVFVYDRKEHPLKSGLNVFW